MPSFYRIVICYVFVWVKYSSQSFCTVQYFILLTFKKEKKKKILVWIDEKVSRKATIPRFVSRLVQVLSVVKFNNQSIWSDSVSHISMLSVDCFLASDDSCSSDLCCFLGSVTWTWEKLYRGSWRLHLLSGSDQYQMPYGKNVKAAQAYGESLPAQSLSAALRWFLCV